MKTRIAAAAMLAMVSGSSAQSWSTFGNFSPTANPNGPWSYGWESAAAFTLFDRSAMLTPDLAVWTGAQFPSDAPCIGINPSPYEHQVPGTTISVPSQAAWCRPGDSGESVVFRFAAPLAGTYIISGLFRQIDDAGVATHVAVRIAGASVMGLDIPAGAAMVMDPSPPRQLAAGDLIEIIVGDGNSGSAMEIEGRISRTTSCYANCDLSTAEPFLNIGDFVCFLNRFAAGDPYANCDGSTSAPILNVNDLTCFLNRFVAGCSAP